MDRLARSRVVATGSVRNNSGIRACNGSWVALEDARHRHERDAAQAGLNEAAGRELKRLWGLRAPQTCAIRDQLGWVNGQISAQPGRRDRFGAQ